MKNIYLYYKGQYYDVGTVVKIQTRWDGIKEATFYGWGAQGGFWRDGVTDSCHWFETEKYIVEIVKPIYPKDLVEVTYSNYSCPPPWDVAIGWIWYIFIMVGGTIFNDRLLIWITATTIFFLWKNGKLGGSK